jgi:molecular chaperone GrpE
VRRRAPAARLSFFKADYMDYAGENPMDKGDGGRGEPGSPDSYARGARDDVTSAAADMADSEGGPEGADTDPQRAMQEQRDRYLRLAAEYDNYRKRSAKERSEAGARAQADLVRQLVDALDDLSRFAHLDPATVDAGTVVQGAEMVEKKLLKTLTGAGLQPINPVDQTFDPALHEAVGTEPALSPEDDHVISRVYQQGYLFNGQLLRPARVVVKQWNG